MSVTARQSHGSPWRTKRVRDNIIVLKFGEERRPWPSEAVKRFLEPGRMNMVQKREPSGKPLIGENEVLCLNTKQA
jgi:hypothetical protein